MSAQADAAGSAHRLANGLEGVLVVELSSWAVKLNGVDAAAFFRQLAGEGDAAAGGETRTVAFLIALAPLDMIGARPRLVPTPGDRLDDCPLEDPGLPRPRPPAITPSSSSA